MQEILLFVQQIVPASKGFLAVELLLVAVVDVSHLVIHLVQPFYHRGVRPWIGGMLPARQAINRPCEDDHQTDDDQRKPLPLNMDYLLSECTRLVTCTNDGFWLSGPQVMGPQTGSQQDCVVSPAFSTLRRKSSNARRKVCRS